MKRSRYSRKNYGTLEYGIEGGGRRFFEQRGSEQTQRGLYGCLGDAACVCYLVGHSWIYREVSMEQCHR